MSIVRRSVNRLIVLFTIVTHVVTSQALALPSGSLRLTPQATTELSVELPKLPNSLSQEDFAAALEEGLPNADVRLDRSIYYLSDLAEHLDHEPVSAFRYVRDRIRFDPYPGVLRGAEGVLAAGAGGAYDRSVLLLALLEEMGVDARLAFGNLDSDTAEKLIDQTFAPRNPRPPAMLMPRSLLERLIKRTQRDYAWLNRAVAGEALGDAAHRSEPDDVKDHVWVQAKIDNTWTDLDTAFLNAEPGQAFAAVTHYSIEPSTDAMHQVTLRVIAETLRNGTLAETDLLEKTLTAAAGQQQQIYLVFVQSGAGIGGTIADKLSPSSSMAPALIIDGEMVKGRTIPGIATPLSAAEDFFFGDNSLASTGLYLDVTVETPHKKTTIRRVLYDRIAAQARFLGSPKETELKELSPGIGIPPQFRSIHQILISTGGLNPHRALENAELATLRMTESFSAGKDFSHLSISEALWPIGVARASWQANAEQLLVGTRDQNTDVRMFVGEPRIFVMSLVERVSENEAGVDHVIDLLHDPVALSARSTVAAKDLAKMQIWYASLQSALETETSEIMGALSPHGSGTVVSASAMIRNDPRRISSLQEALKLGASHALLADLRSGKIVVIDSGADDATTWWSVAPDSGVTSARGDSGLGYTLLPVWFGKGLRRISRSGVSYANYDELHRWATEVTKRARLNKEPAKPAVRSANSRSAANEYLIVLDIGSGIAFTGAEVLGMVLGFQMLLIITMISYGVANERYE